MTHTRRPKGAGPDAACEWDATSAARCANCGFAGTVRNFTDRGVTAGAKGA